MQTRTRARRLALDVLYEAEIRSCLPLDAFGLREEEGWEMPAGEIPSGEALAYTRKLVSGVQEHHAEIDELIAAHAATWAIDRMPIIDRNVLRIGLFELLWGGDVPVPVVINEAVELAKSFSTDRSGGFVNGLLGRIAETRPA